MGIHCRLLDWDSEFFGLQIARLESKRICRRELSEIFEWCAEQKVDCLYFLADMRCSETLEAVEYGGFGLKDFRISYELRDLGKRRQIAENGDCVRPAKPEDLPALEQIAGAAHIDTRFFFDTRIPRNAASQLYRVWIRKSCFDPNSTVLVILSEGAAAGYISCEMDEQENGQIGLLGVDACWRGRGFGMMLLSAALEWFANRGARKVTVITQGRNIAAQRLYQRAGFLTRETEAWHHKWFTQLPLP